MNTRVVAALAAIALIPTLVPAQGAGPLSVPLGKAIRRAVPPPPEPKPRRNWLDQFDRLVLQRVELNGYRALGYHMTFVDGDEDAFGVQNYSGLGGKRFTDLGALSIRGNKVLGAIDFNADIQDSRFRDPQNEKFTVNLKRGGWLLSFGDINGSLTNTNRYASFNRTLRGVQLGYSAGRTTARAVTSQARGQAKTITMSGNNSAGPYYLQASQIVNESETVQVDGVTLQRGVDYTISYEIGAITFISRTIAPSSVIAVTFEAFAANTRLGTVEGAGAVYDIGRFGKLGMTAMRQKATSGSFGSTREEKFQGFGAPGTPYVLQFEPLTTRPITVRVDGILQALGVDYTFDPDNPAIFYFTRFVPSTSEISVIYTPKPTQTVDGDREVWGIDYKIAIGESGEIGLSHATGKLLSEINPSSGSARAYTLKYTRGPMDFSAGVRNIDPGYVSVETRSFNRNEKAVDFQAQYRLSERARATATHNNSLVTTRRLSTTGDWVYTPSRVTSSGVNYELDSGSKGLPLKAEFNRQRSSLGGDQSLVDTMTLGTSGDIKQGRWRLGLRRQSGYAPDTLTTGTPREGFTVAGLDAGLTLTPGPRWNLDAQTSLNSTRYKGESSVGLRQDFAAGYRADRFSAVARYSRIGAGDVTTLGGFLGGSGVGLGGSGFSGGGITTIGATDSTNLNLSLGYTPTDHLNFSVDAYKSRSSGAVSSDSETSGIGFLMSADYGRHRMSMGIDSSRTKFISSTTSSAATTFNILFEGTFTDRLGYNARASYLLTKGSSAFRQSGGSFEGQMSYRLSPREILSGSYIYGNSRGYLPQNDISGSLFYSYRIWNPVTLNVGWRYRNVLNRDPSVTSGAYKFGGLDIELLFSFSP